jgi:hypothetical protein
MPSSIFVKRRKPGVDARFIIEGTHDQKISNRCRFHAIPEDRSMDLLAIFQTQVQMSSWFNILPSALQVNEDEVVSVLEDITRII